jgi:NNP family nitrate/nitrite transporter-like MFS transporter
LVSLFSGLSCGRNPAAAFGAFFIPKSYGTSIELTGGVQGALWGFFIFYVICIVVTWAVYTRKGGLLHDIERRGASSPAAQPAE